MNHYKDYFKRLSSYKTNESLIPEGVDPKEFQMGVDDERGEHDGDDKLAQKLAHDHLMKDRHYYSKLKGAGLEQDECATCGCGDPTDDHSEEDETPYDDFNGGLPKLGGALSVPHRGQPIMMGKVISVGPVGKGPANGELSGYSNVGGNGRGVTKDRGGIEVQPDGEPITAGGKETDSGIAAKTVGGEVIPGEGQRQGGKNSVGTIADTPRLDESKRKVRKIVKEVLKEIRFNKETGKWVRIDEGGHKPGCTCGFCKNKGTFGKKKDKKEDKGADKKDKKDEKDEKEVDENTVDMKMGPSYKTVQPRMYKVMDDNPARTNQYEPEISEQYDEEEECMMNERYTELVNAGRNLNEDEIAEMNKLSERIERLEEKKNWIKKAVDPKHKGYCTPMTKDTCTPKRKALAKRFKSGDLSEAEVNMNMGPSYKVVQPRLYKTAEDDNARTNQYDPEMSESGEPSGDMKLSEEEIQALMKEEPVDEVGGGAVQHSSYRAQGNPDHGNLRQDSDTRWADDLDEVTKKVSKVAKTFQKGMKSKKTKKNPKLKFQPTKHTTSGIHKRKTE